MKRLDDSTDPPWFKALVYGTTGSGKTSLGVTAPKPLILLSEAQGAIHVRQAAKRLGVPVPPMFYMESVFDFRNWVRALQGDKSKPLTVKERFKDPNTGEIVEHTVVELTEWPETVVIDSLTDVCRILIDEIRRESPPKKGQDGLPVDSQRFWQVLADRYKNLVWAFRDVPAHVLFLALSEDREDGDDGAKVRVLTADLAMRKLPRVTASAVNLVAYAFRKEIRDKDGVRIQHAVMTSGPEYMLLKPYRPLRDTEVPNFGTWVNMVRGALAEPLPPAPAPSQESLQSLDDTERAVPVKTGPDETETDPLKIRTPNGTINNCGYANVLDEAGCQICGGSCPDKAKIDAGELPVFSAETKRKGRR